MPLPPADANRRLQHHRKISVEAYSRDDGLWEIDATVSDTKTHETQRVGGIRPAGEPIHDLKLRLVVDTRMNILQSGAESRSVPYPGHCEAHGDRYAQLVGLNLLQGFRRAATERLGGVRGCTHITELAGVLPTAVVQAMAATVFDPQGESGVQPFQLDRCHALSLEGEVVRLHYPAWFRQPGANKLSQNPPPEILAARPGEPADAAPSPFVLNSRKDHP